MTVASCGSGIGGSLAGAALCRKCEGFSVAADGHVYFTTGRANTKVVKASTEFEVVAENRLDDETLHRPSVKETSSFVRSNISLHSLIIQRLPGLQPSRESPYPRSECPP